jgi:hypothetical protein
MTDGCWDYVYLLPGFPLVTRSLLAASWHRLMATKVPEQANERDLHRSTLLSLAGFSFTVAAALAVVGQDMQQKLQLPFWYVLVSCIAYMASLNMQGWKASYLDDEIATSLLEAGNLSMMLALVALLVAGKFSALFTYAAGALALGTWLIDHVIRLTIECRYLRLEQARKKSAGGDSKWLPRRLRPRRPHPRRGR